MSLEGIVPRPQHCKERLRQNAAMGGGTGDLIRRVIWGGMSAIEHVFPMPKRLGTPLAEADRPTATSDPIVLVGGFANAPRGWNEWVRSLRGDGFQDINVFDLPSRGLGDMHESGELLARYIDDVAARTGRKVDVIGFSEGGLLARMAVGELKRSDKVDRLIGLATPNAGIQLLAGAYAKAPKLARWVDKQIPAYGQLLEGSAVLGEIASGDAPLRAAKSGVRYASIYSKSTDTMVNASSARLDGAVNVPVGADHVWRWSSDPTHFDMYHLSDRAYAAARELLLDHPDVNAIAIGQSGKP
jgi:triacylglycerol esterase/lipase EstA (alpha/beta hydrolase family)